MTETLQSIPVSKHLTAASRLVFGAMNLGGWDSNPITKDDEKQAQALLETCLSCGINIVDLADIYTFGKAEAIIGKVLKSNPQLADSLFIQSKIGIVLTHESPVKHYDLSPEYVGKAVEASLARLKMEKLDVLFLHRPDPLADIAATAKVLNQLWHDDRFDFLAVSNMHAGQIASIQQHLDMPIVANQLEMSLLRYDFIEDGITTNMQINTRQGFPRGTLEFCMQQRIQLQAWGALAQGQFNNRSHEIPEVANTSLCLHQLAEKYQCSVNALVIAWLMKHPSAIQPVIGTTQSERIRDVATATQINLSREDWYLILQHRRGHEVP